MGNLGKTPTAAKAAPPLPSIGDSGSLNIIIAGDHHGDGDHSDDNVIDWVKMNEKFITLSTEHCDLSFITIINFNDYCVHCEVWGSNM